MRKKTGYKDKQGQPLSVGDEVFFENESYEVVQNVVPFNHFAIYNKTKTLRLDEVHQQCKKIKIEDKRSN